MSLLLRHGRVCSGGGHWTRKNRFWLAGRRFDHPARQIAFEELARAVDEAKARRDPVARQMQELLPSWSLAEVVAAIQALRGMALIATITLVAEIGDFHRFASPRHPMAYLGLAPSERSSGAKTLRGGITKAGNTRARRVLVEGAWTIACREFVPATFRRFRLLISRYPFPYEEKDCEGQKPIA